MRILLVSNYQPPHMGGIEFAAQSLKSCWLKDGHDVTWLTTDLPRGGRASTPDNVRVSAVNVLESRWQINSPLVTPTAYPQIRRLVREHDVINVHSLAPGLSNVALHAAIRSGKPTIVTQHVGIIPLRQKWLSEFQRHFVCRVASWSVGHGALLTFVGQAVRDWFLQNARIPESKVFMTPAGIDHDTYHFLADEDRAKARAKWKLDGGALNVLFVGRFYDKKGLPLLREVAERSPGIRFTLVGGGPIDPTSWNLPNVRVVSFVSNEELRELYGAHDLFIMPSFGEGWPAVVPQAMACGLACLISEECFQGFNRDPERFLVCRRDAETILSRLSEAAAGKQDWIRDRNGISSYALQTWDWQRTARIYIDLFRTLMPS